MKLRGIRLPLVLLLLASAAFTVAAGLTLFSAFMFYDDEGYVLLSVQNFITYGNLYGQVYSQYGPFPYVFYYVLHLLGLPLTHTVGRVISVLAWSGSATLAAVVTWRATRSSAAMLAVLAAVFVYLWVMISEPTHPGGLIALTTAIMAVLGCHWLGGDRWTRWAAMAGAGSAVLLLTKINIGAYAALSTFAVLMLHSRDDGLRRWAPWLLAGGAAVFPYLLMRPLLGTPWVQTYALVFALSGIAAVGAATRGTASFCGGRQWLAAVLGGSAVALLVLGIIFARGTTPAELWEGIVLSPLRHPAHFSLRFLWPARIGGIAALSLMVFLMVSVLARRQPTGLADTVVASLRLLAAAGVGLMIWRFPEVSPDNQVFGWAAPCLWLFLWPLSGTASSLTRAQTWLGLFFLGQWLHVYPVPGSQIAWGSFLGIPLATIGAWDAACWLSRQHAWSFRHVRTVAVVLQLGLVALAVNKGYDLAQIGKRFCASRSLDLPGAEAVRLPDSTTALFRLLVFNASAHGDMVFSLPGMFSLNLWSGLPTPTLVNVTHWFSLLTPAEQRDVIRALEAHPNACIIVQQGHLEYLRKHQLTPGGPLYDYVMTQFEPAFEIDEFEFRVQRGRRIAPFLTAEMFQQKSAADGGKADGFDTLIRMDLLLPPNQQIGSVELARMDDPASPSLLLQGHNVRVEVAPIDLTGDPRRQPELRKFPFALRGPAMVSLYFNRAGRGFSTLRTFIIVRNPAGAEIALVRLRP